MLMRAAGHVRSADGREVDDCAKSWQKSGQRSVASATDRRARVSRPGPSPQRVRARTTTCGLLPARILGRLERATEVEGQPEPDPGGRLQARPAADAQHLLE